MFVFFLGSLESQEFYWPMLVKVSGRLSKEIESLTHAKAIFPLYSFEVFIFTRSVVKKTSSIPRKFLEMK